MNTTVGPDQFRCTNCGGIFDKAWSDAEANAEAVEAFPDLPDSERAIVCDPCYKAIMALAKQQGWSVQDGN